MLIDTSDLSAGSGKLRVDELLARFVEDPDFDVVTALMECAEEAGVDTSKPLHITVDKNLDEHKVAAFFSALKDCNIVSVSTAFKDYGDVLAAAFAEIKTLEDINMSYCKVGDEGGVALASLPNLKRLKLNDNNHIGDKTAEALSGKASIEYLSLDLVSISNEGAKHIATLPNIKSASLTSHNVDESGLMFFATKGKGSLKELNVSLTRNRRIPAIYAASFVGMEGIEEVSLGRAEMNDYFASMVEQSNSIRSITAETYDDRGDIDAKTLARLCSKEAGLETIFLHNSYNGHRRSTGESYKPPMDTSAAMEVLAKNPNPPTVILSSLKLDVAGIELLNSNPNLTGLSISQCIADSDALVKLSENRNLVRLNVYEYFRANEDRSFYGPEHTLLETEQLQNYNLLELDFSYEESPSKKMEEHLAENHAQAEAWMKWLADGGDVTGLSAEERYAVGVRVNAIKAVAEKQNMLDEITAKLEALPPQNQVSAIQHELQAARPVDAPTIA